MQKLTTGTENIGIGNTVLPDILIGNQNVSIGTSSGNLILGDYNTCLGSNTGQADSNIYSNSTCLGYGSIITGSNQIMLGSNLETVFVPNKLTVVSAIESTAQGIGSIINSGGISCAMTSFFNGIITSSLRVLNYESGATIQTRVYSARNDILKKTTFNSTSYSELYGVDFTPKSINSSLYATFDCYSSVLTSNGTNNDTYQCILLIGTIQVGYKRISVPIDQRDVALGLFPISGHRLNTSLSALRVSVQPSTILADDDLIINSPAWSLCITEIQN
jgi:hypothetical protein